MKICLGLNEFGKPCPGKGLRNGFCRKCDPAEQTRQKHLKIKEAKKAAEAAAKREQAEELDNIELEDMVKQCQSVEDIRKLELKILGKIATGTIDPRAGSSIVQLLKHQVDLLDRKKLDDPTITEEEKDKIRSKARKMTAEEMLMLLGEFAQGYKNLVKAVREEPAENLITIEVKEVKND